MNKIHKFSDFAKPEFSGDKIKIQDIINREILLNDFELKKSKFPKEGNPDCLIMKIEIDNKNAVIFTGSRKLKDLCVKYKDKMPFYTTIVRDGKRYILS